MLSCFSHVRLSATPWTVTSQAPLSMGFSRQEYQADCCAVLQRVFPTQGSNPRLLCLLRWQAGSLPLVPLVTSRWVNPMHHFPAPQVFLEVLDCATLLTRRRPSDVMFPLLGMFFSHSLLCKIFLTHGSKPKCHLPRDLP